MGVTMDEVNVDTQVLRAKHHYPEGGMIVEVGYQNEPIDAEGETFAGYVEIRIYVQNAQVYNQVIDDLENDGESEILNNVDPAVETITRYAGVHMEEGDEIPFRVGVEINEDLEY